MKRKWYTNWLLVITLCLLFSSFGIFVFSFRKNITVTKCIYGDSQEGNCICTKEGEIVCEEDIEKKDEQEVVGREFVSDDLNFNYSFLNFFDAKTFTQDRVKFKEISHVQDGLRISVERVSECNEKKEMATQLGFYKLESERLTLTTRSNLTDSSFYISCIVDNTFLIRDFNIEDLNIFDIYYQDEMDVIYRANNCVYEGYIRNSDDVYKSANNCYLCKCINGENKCERDKKCLE